jgi:hypothetical protein
MGAVIPFRRPVASRAVIAKLVELGHLKPAKRYKEDAVKGAVARLREGLQRDGAICDGDLSRRSAPAPADAANSDPAELTGDSISAPRTGDGTG